MKSGSGDPPPCLGASILTFAICERTNAVFFLLGREKFWKRYRNDSEKWSDFGGRAKAGESAEAVAAREFVEETCGCVRYKKGDALPMQGQEAYDAIRRSLERKEYVYRFEFEVKQADRGVYTTFVRQVPLDPASGTLFSRVRQNLLQKETVNPDVLEKTKIAWFGLQQVRNAAFSSPMLRCDNYQKEYVRRWFRDRMRLILPYLAV